MIEIEYNNQFINDLKKLKNTPVYAGIRQLSFDELPMYTHFSDINDLKKMQGHEDYYRIKYKDYRIGIKKIDNTHLVIMRVLHRKEIYRYFP